MNSERISSLQCVACDVGYIFLQIWIYGCHRMLDINMSLFNVSGNICFAFLLWPVTLGPWIQYTSKAETTHRSRVHCEDVFLLTWKLPLMNKSWQRVTASHFTFLSFTKKSHLAHSPNICPWETREKTRTHHHRRDCGIIVSMEMAGNRKPIINSEVLTLVHWWYVTSIDEYAIMCAEELINLPRSKNYDSCIYHSEDGLTRACFQIALLGLISQWIEVGHWLTIGVGKKRCSALEIQTPLSTIVCQFEGVEKRC